MNDVMLNFWITEVIEEPLEKGMSGSPMRMLGGYAAGTTKDFQDEQMVLEGMNFDYLTSNQGIINWDHNPRLIIGKPSHVGMIKGKGLYVKGILSQKSDYPNPSHPDTQKALEQAEYAWDHAMRHKSNPNVVAPLAWSIEGKKVLKSGRIYKSMATAVALTNQAVNPHDCTVTALAKSFRETETEETTNFLIQNGFDIDDINSFEKAILFGKSIGLSVDESKNLIRKIRGLYV